MLALVAFQSETPPRCAAPADPKVPGRGAQWKIKDREKILIL